MKTPNNGSKKELPTKYILLVMTIVCVISILIGYTGTDISAPLHNAAGYVFVPMQKGIYSVGSWMYDRNSSFATIKQLQDENALLKQQVIDLTEQVDNFTLEEYELESLRKLYKLDKTYSEYEKVGANVIARSSDSWFSVFTIDKGSNDGIEEGMNVIADGGLVGIITSVSANYSVVKSIIEDSSNVSAMVLTSGDNCIVSGSLDSMTGSLSLPFSNLDDSAGVAGVGDAIVVSNISDRYVSGLLIGYITEIEKNSNDITKSGTISPVVDFKHLSQVLVITATKEISDYE